MEYIVSIDDEPIDKKIINEVSISVDGDIYKMKDAQSFAGKIIPIGAILKIFFPAASQRRNVLVQTPILDAAMPILVNAILFKDISDLGLNISRI